MKTFIRFLFCWMAVCGLAQAAGFTPNGFTTANEADARSNAVYAIRNGMGFNSGFITNNGVIIYATNGIPRVAAPDGSLGIGSGQIYTMTNGVWVAVGGGGGGSGEANTASSLGSGVGIVSDKVGVDLQFRSFVGVGATVSTNATTLTITADAAGAAAARMPTNLGTAWLPTFEGPVTNAGFADANGDYYFYRMGMTNGSLEKIFLGLLNGGNFVGPIIAGTSTNTTRDYPAMTVFGLATAATDIATKAPVVSSLAGNIMGASDMGSPFQFGFRDFTNRPIWGVGDIAPLTGDPRYFLILAPRGFLFVSNSMTVGTNLNVGKLAAFNAAISTNGFTNISGTLFNGGNGTNAGNFSVGGTSTNFGDVYQRGNTVLTGWQIDQWLVQTNPANHALNFSNTVYGSVPLTLQTNGTLLIGGAPLFDGSTLGANMPFIGTGPLTNFIQNFNGATLTNLINGSTLTGTNITLSFNGSEQMFTVTNDGPDIFFTAPSPAFGHTGFLIKPLSGGHVTLHTPYPIDFYPNATNNLATNATLYFDCWNNTNYGRMLGSILETQ